MSNNQTTDKTKTSNIEKEAATRRWIEAQFNEPRQHELEEDLESEFTESTVESSDYTFDSETESFEEGEELNTTVLGAQKACSDVSSLTIDSLTELLSKFNSVQTFMQTIGNLNIENSTGVHIGNVTNINGNIQIIHKGRRSHKPKKSSDYQTTTQNKAEALEKEESVDKDAFLNRIKFKFPKESSMIIPRSSWLAQSPMEPYQFIQKPIEYVIISHTATESSEKRAINVRIVRDTQCFHIESRGWNDIAYNFLIGCDGNIYEGRGWRAIGAHTFGYNNFTLGVSFIGCFMRELPTEVAMNAFNNLMKIGVAEGYLVKDYKIMCHCQCCSTESPGRRFFEEIQKWEHFYSLESNDDSSNKDESKT